MAILIINDSDYSAKLKNFSISCKECGSTNVTLEVDWAAYPSGAWCKVRTICEGCKAEEDIYDF
jgi:hypothetical protein